MTMNCESCGMPITTGPYCSHCAGPDGVLQDFPERFERMVAWAMRENPTGPRAEAEARTIAYMSTMPAWKNHPEVLRRLRSSA